MTAVQRLIEKLTPEEKAEAFVELASASFTLDDEQRELVDARLSEFDGTAPYAIMRIGEHDYIVPRYPAATDPDLSPPTPERIAAMQAALADPDNSWSLEEMLLQIDSGITPTRPR